MIGPLNISEDGNREENFAKLCGLGAGISMLREQIASPTLNHTFYLFLFIETSSATTIRKTVTKSLFFSSPTQGTPNNGTSNTYFSKVKSFPVYRRVGFGAAGPPPMGHRAPSLLCTSIKPASLPRVRCWHSQHLIHFVTLLPSASLSEPPKWPRSRRLLRRPSPVLGSPITSS